jgi:hypothetical protein
VAPTHQAARDPRGLNGRGPHDEWLQDSAALDLAAVHLQAKRLTQLLPQDRAKARACHDFVRRIRLGFASGPARTAPEVLQATQANALEKGTLLVALLRCCGIPARLRVFAVSGEHLQGLHDVELTTHSIVEAHVEGRWVRTDTYLMDVALALGSRTKLLQSGRRWGWGLCLEGAAFWNGAEDALMLFGAGGGEVAPLLDFGMFHDWMQFNSLAASLGQTLSSRIGIVQKMRVGQRAAQLRAEAPRPRMFG